MHFKSWLLNENLQNINNLENSQAWLDPNGVFYPINRTKGGKYNWLSHSGYALKHKMNMRQMFDDGWMRIMFIGDILYASNDVDVPLNKIQKDNLIDFAIFSRRFKGIVYEGSTKDQMIWSKE